MSLRTTKRGLAETPLFSIKRMITVISSFMAFLVVVAVGVTILLIKNQKDLSDRQKVRFEALKLAAELRESSELLTQMARTYVMTQIPYFEYEYRHIVDVRNGTRLRPDGSQIPLRTLIEGLNLTVEEEELLKTGEDHSNELAKIEEIAMHAAKGLFADSEGAIVVQGGPDYRLAQDLMFNSSYVLKKADIMDPISQLIAMVDSRTEIEVSIFQSRKKVFATIQLGTMFCFILAITFSIVLLKKRLSHR